MAPTTTACIVANKKSFAEAGIDDVPHTVGEDGYYFEHVPLFGGAEPKRVIDDKGKFDNANDAVIQALIEAERAAGARAAEASISALLAVEGAGDLPQHAAVVRGHRQAASR